MFPSKVLHRWNFALLFLVLLLFLVYGEEVKDEELFLHVRSTLIWIEAKNLSGNLIKSITYLIKIHNSELSAHKTKPGNRQSTWMEKISWASSH